MIKGNIRCEQKYWSARVFTPKWIKQKKRKIKLKDCLLYQVKCIRYCGSFCGCGLKKVVL